MPQRRLDYILQGGGTDIPLQRGRSRKSFEKMNTQVVDEVVVESEVD